ncbi:MAG: superoxide dismutase [Thermonemataceae bacterium]|nr:superoxide dismutase [Thermonemataceae bacterium]
MAFKPEWLFAQTPTIFELPALPYAYEALEPHFDTLTMQTHHTKHHAAYVKNLNEGIVGTKFEKMSLEEILANVTPAFAKIRNNAGGHYNHSFFWKTLTPQQNQKEPTGKLAQDIQAQFGSFEKFKQEFSAKATALFGSGWAWLAEHPKKGLFIESTPNQDNLLMKKIYKQTASPILGLDVWEHAYYLKYQNRRAEYIKAFWNLVDWENISKEYNNKR